VRERKEKSEKGKRRKKEGENRLCRLIEGDLIEEFSASCKHPKQL